MNKSVVTGILVKKDDKVLLVKKPEKIGPYAGMYLTPGGGVNTGEEIDEAVQRELFEETGVKVEHLKREFFDDSITQDWKGDETHYIMLLYTADYLSGDLRPTAGDDDGLEVIRWFSNEEIKEIRLSPPLKNFLLMLGYQI